MLKPKQTVGLRLHVWDPDGHVPRSSHCFSGFMGLVCQFPFYNNQEEISVAPPPPASPPPATCNCCWVCSVGSAGVSSSLGSWPCLAVTFPMLTRFHPGRATPCGGRAQGPIAGCTAVAVGRSENTRKYSPWVHGMNYCFLKNLHKTFQGQKTPTTMF